MVAANDLGPGADPELVFNLFMFHTGRRLVHVGGVGHVICGSDTEKLTLLRNRAEADWRSVKRLPIPEAVLQAFGGRPLTERQCQALGRLGRQLDLFEPVFANLGVDPRHPLCCMSHVVDGRLRVDGLTDGDRLTLREVSNLIPEGSADVPDYLDDYRIGNGLDLASLLNDDFLNAIKLLLNTKHYVSAAKLLLSFLDTVAFLEYGDQKNGFQRWLDAFADMAAVGVLADELWAFRNALLHTTTVDSRAVVGGAVPVITFYVAPPQSTPPAVAAGKQFNLTDLYFATCSALEAWLRTFNHQDKLAMFVERYDRILSDKRHVQRSRS